MIGRVIVALAAATVWLAACGSGATGVSHPTPSGSPTASGLPSAGNVTATIPSVGLLTSADDAFGVAANDSDVWVWNGETGKLSRIATASNSVVATVGMKPGCARGKGCGNVALGFGSAWVANEVDGTISRIDLTTNKIVATIAIGADAAPMVYTTSTSVWSANYLTNTYSRIDPMTNKVVATIANHDSAESVSETAGSIWLCDAGRTPALTRLDASSLQPQAEIDLSTGGQPYECFNTAAADQSLWVTAVNSSGLLLERIDTATNKVTASAPAAGTPVAERGLVTGGGFAWIFDDKLGACRLDPQSVQPVACVRVAGGAGVAFGAGSLWVATGGGNLLRIAPAQ